MKEVFISFTVFIACVIVAVTSQVIAPTKVSASNLDSTTKIQITTSPKTIQTPFELDPNDPNPNLFFMAKNTAASTPLNESQKIENSIETPSGLIITDLEIGNGAEAVTGKNVSVNYRGTLENGKEFDSSYGRGPFSFPLGAGRVIKGWDEGVVGMKINGKRRLEIPPSLGYGNRGAGGGVIPPNATLIFEIELLKIN